VYYSANRILGLEHL